MVLTITAIILMFVFSPWSWLLLAAIVMAIAGDRAHKLYRQYRREKSEREATTARTEATAANDRVLDEVYRWLNQADDPYGDADRAASLDLARWNYNQLSRRRTGTARYEQLGRRLRTHERRS